MGKTRLGTNVEYYRGQLYLSQGELALRCEVSRDTIQKIESGQRRRPHATTLVALAGVFGVSLEDLTGEDVYERPASPKPVMGSRTDEDMLSDERVRQSIASGSKVLYGRDLGMVLILVGTLIEKRLYQQVAEGVQDGEQILRRFFLG